MRSGEHRILLQRIERPSDGFKWQGNSGPVLSGKGEYVSSSVDRVRGYSRPHCCWLIAADVDAQAPGAGTRTGRAAALNDLTGYWVSVVTEDWRLRMIVPDPRDYLTLPLNLEASKVADAWDPARDQAAGEQCKVVRRRGDHADSRAVAHRLAG